MTRTWRGCRPERRARLSDPTARVPERRVAALDSRESGLGPQPRAKRRLERQAKPPEVEVSEAVADGLHLELDPEVIVPARRLVE